MRLSVKAWLKKLSTQKDALRRVLFSFLSIWVHAVVLFYLTTVLFSGNKAGAKKDLTQQPKTPLIIQVSMASPPPTAAAADDQNLAPTPIEENADSSAKTAVPEPMPTPPVEDKSKIEEKPAKLSAEDGIFDCDALDKKPERIILGTATLDLPPNDDPTGQLVLRLKIHSDGTVLAVTVEDSTLGARAQRKVVESVRTTLFHPGEMGGVPVDCDMKYEFSLTPPEKP